MYMYMFIRTDNVLDIRAWSVSSLIAGCEKRRSAPLALLEFPAPGLRTMMSSALVELIVGEEVVAICGTMGSVGKEK